MPARIVVTASDNANALYAFQIWPVENTNLVVKAQESKGKEVNNITYPL